MKKTTLQYGFGLISLILLVGGIFGGGLQAQEDSGLDALINALPMRNIGPANMGGRTVDLAVVETNTSVIYAAVGPSGVFKSTNAGVTWEPCFTGEVSVAAGAVAVSQSHPNIVWVGTGEGTSRNSVGIGDGVYKSVDGGKTWTNMGLRESRHISRIIIDRIDPDVVYIGAHGHLWGPNPERGLFKTEDGGETWSKVLYVNEDTGIADLAADPSNNKILYAAMWDFRRKPFHFRSGGEGSGLYRTLDGGDTWAKVHAGLPAGTYGRIGLDVSRSHPNIVYALVEAKNGGLFRSEDHGETWTRACDKQTYDRINFRPFYYSRLTVDPNNPLVVYVYSGQSYVSRDGGKTFTTISRGIHPDHHTLWVDPADSLHLIEGNDGGIDISYDGGLNWRDVKTNAWAEVYQIGLDMRDPYYVYVGLQDNGSWGGPSNSLDPSGILNLHWFPVGGGDGFYAQIDPENHRTVYRNAHMGGIVRFDIQTGDSQDIKPVAPLDEPPYRFNWNSPIHLSPHNREVLYFGGNFLFKSTDGGRSWIEAGPDLSGNDPEKQEESGGITVDNTGAEIHCTIYTIAESPVTEGVIWVGTDDGLVQVTKDGGQTWTDVTANIRGLPRESWVTRIEASHFEAGTAYATFDRHRWDDYRPYVYRTKDYGKTWTSLQANLPEVGYLLVVREDLQNPDLLFLGSEFGLFISLDGGERWLPYTRDFPTIAVRDIQIHPRDRDLVVGTHGRGVYILDDIRWLEEQRPQEAPEKTQLFPPSPATLYSFRNADEYYGDPEFSGRNPEYGACITYSIGDKPQSGRTRLEVFDTEGVKVAALVAPSGRGLKRTHWNLRVRTNEAPNEAPRRFGRFGGVGSGPFVLPGDYTVRLTVGDTIFEQPLEVRAQEGHDFSPEDRRLQQTYAREMGDLVARGRDMMRSMNGLVEELEEVGRRIRRLPEADPGLKEAFSALKAKAEKVHTGYSNSVEGATGYRRPVRIALRGGTLPEQLSRLARTVSGYQGAPTRTQIDQFNDIKSAMEPLLTAAAELLDKDVPELNGRLNAAGYPVIEIRD